MNIIFFGSSRFASLPLHALINRGHRLACVVTQPDRHKGRGLHIEGTLIKNLAKEAGIQVYQPEKVNSKDSYSFLKALNPDLFIVVSYGQILSKEILSIPKILSLNIHASLLPQYRGASPIHYALINGDKYTGITFMKMTKEMDAGPLILQKEIEIKEDDTFIDLEDRLSRVACEILPDVISSIEQKKIILREQDPSKATFAPKLKKKEGLIDWNKNAMQIYNLIRGCFYWPGAFTYYKGRLLKIYKATIIELKGNQAPYKPGEVTEVSKKGIIIASGKGYLLIQELQIEGKRRMSIAEFIQGHKISTGEIFTKK